MNTVTIPVTKTITTTVPNGHIEIYLNGDSYRVWYYNDSYRNSPFLLSNSFSSEYSVDEIMKSSEVRKFLERFE